MAVDYLKSKIIKLTGATLKLNQFWPQFPQDWQI